MALTILRIEATIAPGTSLEHACQEAAVLARQHGARVHFTFHGVPLDVGTDPVDAIQIYQRALVGDER